MSVGWYGYYLLSISTTYKDITSENGFGFPFTKNLSIKIILKDNNNLKGDTFQLTGVVRSLVVQPLLFPLLVLVELIAIRLTNWHIEREEEEDIVDEASEQSSLLARVGSRYSVMLPFKVTDFPLVEEELWW